MSDVRVSTLSAEFVRVLVTAKLNGEFVDPTADVVSLAFVAPGVDPDPDEDFVTGEWEAVGEDSYYARILIGPGSDVGILEPGSYAIWVKVEDDPEIPIKKTTNRVVVY